MYKNNFTSYNFTENDSYFVTQGLLPPLFFIFYLLHLKHLTLRYESNCCYSRTDGRMLVCFPLAVLVKSMELFNIQTIPTMMCYKTIWFECNFLLKKMILRRILLPPSPQPVKP